MSRPNPLKGGRPADPQAREPGGTEVIVRIRVGPPAVMTWLEQQRCRRGPGRVRRRSTEDAIMGEMAPQPELYEGPILEDLAKAAGTGGAVGGVAGFMLGSLFHAVRPVDPLKIGSWGAGLMSTFGVWIVLWSRILG